MRAIINRYLTKEVVYAWVAVTAVLLFILLSNQFARVLGDAAAGKLPREAVLQIIGLSSIGYLTVLVPVGLFLAVMLALGRLFMDSEMAAINACGLGPLRVYQPIAVVSIVLSVILAGLSLFVSPWAAGKAQIITENSKQQAGLGALEPGRFRSASGVVFYAEGVNDEGMLLNVFLQRRRGNQIELAVAETGEVRKELEETMIILRNGRRYEGEPGTLGFRIVHFAEHGMPVRTGGGTPSGISREALPTMQLLQSDSRADAAELHWRMSAPISAMLLGLLAVPLSRTRPRQGRYGKLGIGIGIYLVYANLLGAAQVWIQQGTLSPGVGMWPVHGVLAVATALLLWRETSAQATTQEEIMTTLDRYILAGVLRGTMLVLFVLLALNAFVSFISQVDNVGQGSYTTSSAIAFVALNMPTMVYRLLPIATLLGALLGLGNLASHSELIVMRAAGVSPWRLTRSVIIAGALIALVGVALGEFIAPPSEQYAKRNRTMALHNQLSMGQGQSGWIRDGNVIINFEQLMTGDRAGGIYVFTFGDGQELESIVQARTASFDENGIWILDDSSRTEFLDDQLVATKMPRFAQTTALSPELLGLSVIDPDSLASKGLLDYIKYLRGNDLDADRYVTAFWSRVATIVSIVIMAALALPFVFGPLRSTGTGQRMFMGVLLGAGYFLINRLVANSGAVYGLDPAVTAWLPTIVLFVVTVGALARVR